MTTVCFPPLGPQVPLLGFFNGVFDRLWLPDDPDMAAFVSALYVLAFVLGCYSVLWACIGLIRSSRRSRGAGDQAGLALPTGEGGDRDPHVKLAEMLAQVILDRALAMPVDELHKFLVETPIACLGIRELEASRYLAKGARASLIQRASDDLR